MASKEDLMRIGREGFDLIEQFMDSKGRKTAAAERQPPPPHVGSVVPQETMQVSLLEYKPQQNHLYQVKPKEKMKRYEFRGGALTVVDYSKTKRNSAPIFYHFK